MSPCCGAKIGRVDVERLVDQLEADGPRLATAADRATLDAPVEHCPGWTVRDLVLHIGGVHRWAARIVREQLSADPTPAVDDLERPPADTDPVEWFRAGHAALVETLRAAPDGLAAFTFLPAPSPLHFWTRRQAHETAIHRADAELAAGGPVTAFPTDFAKDGIDELLFGFAARRYRPRDRTVTIGLRADDGPSWSAELGGEQILVEPLPETGWTNVMISGSSSELYLWLWNRPSVAQLRGDRDAAAQWGDTVRVRWS